MEKTKSDVTNTNVKPSTRSTRVQAQALYKVPFKQVKFEGKCDALKGHVFDCLDALQANIFSKTQKELAEYVGCT